MMTGCGFAKKKKKNAWKLNFWPNFSNDHINTVIKI